MNFQTWHIIDSPNTRWNRGRDRQNTPPNNVSMQSRLMLLFLMQILDVYHVTDAQTMGNTRHFGFYIKWYPCKFCSSTTTAQDTSGFSHSSLAVGPQGGSTWSQLHTMLLPDVVSSWATTATVILSKRQSFIFPWELPRKVLNTVHKVPLLSVPQKKHCLVQCFVQALEEHVDLIPSALFSKGTLIMWWHSHLLQQHQYPDPTLTL